MVEQVYWFTLPAFTPYTLNTQQQRLCRVHEILNRRLCMTQTAITFLLSITHYSRTIHALFTHYSYHFRGGAVGVTAQNSKLQALVPSSKLRHTRRLYTFPLSPLKLLKLLKLFLLKICGCANFVVPLQPNPTLEGNMSCEKRFAKVMLCTIQEIVTF